MSRIMETSASEHRQVSLALTVAMVVQAAGMMYLLFLLSGA